MFTCSKVFADIPFAHRQHRHAGHCSLVHGHNWSIKLTFGCERLDENGFVVDFGGLKYVRAWIDERLDHACVFNTDDPLLPELRRGFSGAFKFYVVDSCSCEGLAAHVFTELDPLIRKATSGRAYLVEVEILEDSKNSARFAPDKPDRSDPSGLVL